MTVKTGAGLLEQIPPPGYLAEWTDVVAQPKVGEAHATQSVFIFRVATEWLALPTAAVTEITSVNPVHSLPHRTNGIVLGITNVGGEILVCVSLGALLGLDRPADSNTDGSQASQRRFVTLAGGGVRLVCIADEVFGIHRFDPREVTDVPATLAHAAVRHTRALLRWNERSVGLLDDQLLFYTLKKSLA